MSDPIRFEGVHRSFDGRSVLAGLSFTVRRGEIYALLGRNGAGKTTALSILLGFLRPMGGRCTVLGEPSESLTPATRLRIGLVNEGAPLYGWMRVGGAVEFEAGSRANFERKYAEDALRRLGISMSKRIMTLSRGQRAQLALVFAMAGDPEVLVLDDPAMGLDAVMRREFLEAMIDLLGREGRSVLFSSHILPDVERIADRVGILHGGRLIVDATIEDLKRRVQKRFARGAGEGVLFAERVPGLLRARSVRDGLELTLLDLDAQREMVLRSLCPGLSEPTTPTLEDLFIEMTTERAAEALMPNYGGVA
ncbi:MAG: ATP-binding cassette domain-containing protein [Planctomycetota bacterium]